MREIKFRAWDNHGKCLVELPTFEEICKMDGFAIDDLEFEQFTGLRDKNGKDIYEGDILQQPPHKKRWMVEYYGGAFKLIEKGKFAGHLCFMNEDDIEVIGNIHENPELMEAI